MNYFEKEADDIKTKFRQDQYAQATADAVTRFYIFKHEEWRGVTNPAISSHDRKMILKFTAQSLIEDQGWNKNDAIRIVKAKNLM